MESQMLTQDATVSSRQNLGMPLPPDSLVPFSHLTDHRELKNRPWHLLSRAEQEKLLARPEPKEGNFSAMEVAQNIIKRVRADGDEALRQLGREFDSWKGSWVDGSLEIHDDLWDRAFYQITKNQKMALERAIDQVERFHLLQKPKNTFLGPRKGLTLWRRFRPLNRVGIYVPGGHAPLVSSLIMSAVPARIAGCKHVIIFTPADAAGQVHPAILVAARLTGVHHLYRSGGAQAIAAMAYGTQEVPKVDKIFGPGNSFVTAAKSLCAMDPQGAAIDMPAGPSEVMVVADTTANPSWVAADLLSQAEHGDDSHVVLVVKKAALFEPILREVKVQLQSLKQKGEHDGSRNSCYDRAQRSLHQATVLFATSDEHCLNIINRYAPEHLILQIENAPALADGVEHAGSIFLGHLTPESLGDYASGTNHVLPTHGFARAYSGLGLEAFYKSTTLQTATLEGLRELGPTVVELATLEGLWAHASAVEKRLDQSFDQAKEFQSPLQKNTGNHSPSPSNFLLDNLYQTMVKPLISPHCLNMEGYISARSLVENKSEVEQKKIFLDANEKEQDPWGNPYGLNRYPAPQPRNLVGRLADYYQVKAENLLLTSGADQGIDLLIKIFCSERSDSIIITPPTYGYYAVSAQIQNIPIRKVPLIGEHFKLDLHGIIEEVEKKGAKLIFLCSPQNPTGMVTQRAEILKLAHAIQGQAILVVDEAYAEYAQEDTLTPMLLQEWGQYPHLIVLRTLSKAFGLAGLRLGSILACKEIIEILQKVRPPYPLSQTVIQTAEQALDLAAYRAPVVSEMKKKREYLSNYLKKSPLVRRVFPSQTNFLLVAFHDHRRLMDAWNMSNIVVRDRSDEEGLHGCLRITIGSDDEMIRLLDILKKVEKTPHG